MKKLCAMFLGMVILVGIAGVATAQDTASHDVILQISEICVIDVAPAGSITLTLGTVTTGGDTPADATNNTKYLQYTSLVPSGETRRITAALDSGESAPAGTALRVQASGISGNEGTPAGQITLTDSATDLVTGIGSCATGTGATDGAQLTYTFTVTDFSQLEVTAGSTVTVTYTLTDSA